MENWTIGAFAHTLAEQPCDERWPSAHRYGGGPRDIVVKDLATQIKDHIGSLTRLGAIRPRNPATGAAGDPSSAPDETYILTRTNANEVTNYVRGDDQWKRDFPENFARRKATGRYALIEAAGIIEAETGEPYETILDRFKEDAANNVLPTYEPGWNQPIKYGAARQPREIDEAYWSDLNNRLENTSFSFRFPSPRERRRDLLDPAIDKALDHAETPALKSVWLQLEGLARSREPPFTGQCKGTWLEYTNSKNEIVWFSKKSLGQRLVERGHRHSAK
jgi:hypothetical protein